MNRDGEGLAQERRIWWPHYFDNCLIITLVDAEDRRFTISEVRDFIERHVQNGTNDTKLFIGHYGDDPHPTDQECTLLGQSCQPFVHSLQELRIGGWTDMEMSCILKQMSLQSSTIRCFRMNGRYGERHLSIRTLCDDIPSTLQTLQLYDVVFTSVDCQLLGKMISKKERALDCLQLSRCSFPCLLDFFTFIAGFCKAKIPSDRCGFWGCTVNDTSIPTHDVTNSLEFSRIFGVFWKWRNGEDEKCTPQHLRAERLQKSADDILNYFRPMQRAGLSRLLLLPSQNSDNVCDIETRQPREQWEWVKVLGHEAVIDRVDLLFHILLLNPEVCVRERDCSEPQHQSGQPQRKKVRRN